MQPARSDFDILLGIVLTFAMIAGLGWFLWRTLKRTEDPPRLIFKWVLTVLGMGFLLKQVVIPMSGYSGGYNPAMASFWVIQMAIVGLYLAIIWRHNLAMMVAKPFASLYDGGDVESDPKPFYSSALAKRSRGKFLEARTDVLNELARFPTDVEGQMLLAEIEAQDMNDLGAAAVTIQRFINQKGHAPINLAYALNSMADWHLKYARNRDAARECFEKIIDLLPESEWALRAEQRIAHLGTTEMLLGSEERRLYKVAHIEGDPGLELKWGTSLAPVEDESGLAAKYVKHLEEFPHDTEIREKLARLYAEYYQRLDLAADQLEQLIQYPNQPVRQVVNWLNVLAELQVKLGADYDAVRATLQRIIDLYPDGATANVAQSRIEHLRLELKGQKRSQTIALGSYEDDLGLKGNSPHQL